MQKRTNSLSPSGLQQILAQPPSEWEALADEMRTKSNLTATVRELEGIAERAARLARYLDEREGHGCGDQGHAAAVKAQNKAGRAIRKAFGYNMTHDLGI